MNNREVKFFLPKGTINDATEYYCNLLEKSFEERNYTVDRVDSVKFLRKEDIVITIRPADQIKIGKGYKGKINWFQGIGSEEYVLLHGKNIRSFIISRYLEYVEKKSLVNSDLCIFVSQRMKKYYEDKYKLNLENKSVIIPCYNQHLNKEFFYTQNRYEKLNFVYAGGLFAWQCIDRTLIIFREIYNMDNSATLTLLTGDKENAYRLIKKYGLNNVIVDYCKLDELQEKLAEYKYAFLIREDNIVNNVSTPTKMNSYLASGLIPIYTDVIDDFEKNIKIDSFSVKLSANLSDNQMADEIMMHHKSKNINAETLYKSYTETFIKYYNDNMYIEVLKNKLQDFEVLKSIEN